MQSTSTVLVAARFNSGSCISEGDKSVFGTMASIWKLLYYSLQKQALKGIQDVQGFPELKIVKPSDTKWLSNELYVKAICKELPHCCKPFHSSNRLEMLRH